MGLWGKKKNDDKFSRCLVDIKIYSGLEESKILSSGFANYAWLVVLDDKVYWRLNDKFDEWDMYADGLNQGDRVSYKMPYVEAIQEKRWKDADRLITEFANKYD